MGPEVLIFMISMNCPLDFDSELWSGFDTAMLQEWNITAATSCQEVDRFPSGLYAYKNLANTILTEANTTAAVSHKLLHLVLEDRGHEKSCYVDEVHENQFRYALMEMGGNKRPILERFDC